MISLVVFLGGLGVSDVERMVDGARIQASLDCVEAALASGEFAGAVVVTDDASLSVDIPAVRVDLEQDPFHFGRRLAGLISKRILESVLYMGGGSVPLFAMDDFAQVARAVNDGVVVTNNAYSSDIVGFRGDPDVLAVVEGVERDNALARALEERAGLKVEELPRSLATQMDIDGPSDLAVMAVTGFGGPRLRSYLGALELDVERYKRVLPLFVNRQAQIVVAGRVGSHAWQYLERETACRVRLFAEERGLEAEGRAESRAARSLLGFYLEAVGSERFFAALAELGDAAFIDTRVLLAHMGMNASREERFLSDLGRWQEIGEPFLREFTKGACEAAIPVILGGHSLMSGGLMALNEFAWKERERLAAD